MSILNKLKFGQLMILAIILGLFGIGLNYELPKQASASAGTDMIIMWDGTGSAPTGWSFISDSGGDMYQKMPRGAATYGGTGGADTHISTPQYLNETVGAATQLRQLSTTYARSTHSHGSISGVTSAGVTSLPPYRNLRFIQYDTGIPTQIPSGGIVMFDTTVPAGFTQYSAQDGRFLRGESSANVGTTGGSSTHSHNYIATLDASATAGIGAAGATANQAAIRTHTHSLSWTSNAVSHVPLNVQVILGQASSNVSLPVGMLAMFDGSPSSAWDVKSDSGDDFENRYIQADTSYVTGGGASIHAHALQSVTSGAPSQSASYATGTTTTALASNTHTHNVNIRYGNDANAPAYRDVIIAKYSPVYTPEQRNWRWYDADDTEDPDNSNGDDILSDDAIEDEDTTNSSTRIVYPGNLIKLRIAVGETGGAGETDIAYILQYDTSNTFPSPTLLGCETTSSVSWRVQDGAGATNDTSINNLLLTGSNSAGEYNDNYDCVNLTNDLARFDPAASTNYEHEFTIQPNPDNNPSSNTTYYFRLSYCKLVFAGGKWGCPGSFTAIPKNGSYNYPSLTTAAAYDLEISTAPTSADFGLYTKNDNNDNGGSINPVQFGPIGFWDKRGTGGTYTVTVDGTDMEGPSDDILNDDIHFYPQGFLGPALQGAFDSNVTGITQADDDLDTTLNAYVDDNSATNEGDGGFFFYPWVIISDLNNQLGGVYEGTITVTII